MGSPSAVVCREIFDENSQPSVDEISEYAQQLGIDPESEGHLLPLARDGLMQALPAPWKAYYNEKLETHYYYNEETKKTQWEHPLDKVYKDLVKKARDASMHDDTCASVQELLTFEENPKILERLETKVESDDEELTTDSSRHLFGKQTMPKRLAPLGRPPLAPLTRLDKKLGEIRMSPLRRSMDQPLRPNTVKNPDRDFYRPPAERPKHLFKQNSEIIDLKINVLNSPDEDNFSPLLGAKSVKVDRGLPLTGRGNIFFKIPKSDNPSPDTEKSFPLDSTSMTKSDPPKGILREKLTETLQRKAESVVLGKGRHAASLEEDKKSVRFQLENLPEPAIISPSSNSSSDQNDGQSSIATPIAKSVNPLNPSNPIGPITLSPIVTRPPLPHKLDSPKGTESNKTFETSKPMGNPKVAGSRDWMRSDRESLVDTESETSSIPSLLLPDPKLEKEMVTQSDINNSTEETVDSPKPDDLKETETPNVLDMSRASDGSKIIVNPKPDDAKQINLNNFSTKSSPDNFDVTEEESSSTSEYDASPEVKESPRITSNVKLRDNSISILSPKLAASPLLIGSPNRNDMHESPRNNSLKIDSAKERDSSKTSNSSKPDIDDLNHFNEMESPINIISSKDSPRRDNSFSRNLDDNLRTDGSPKSQQSAVNGSNVVDDQYDQKLESPEVEKHEHLLSESNQSPKRRVLRPPAADYIKPDLFQKNFQKISDLVRPGDINTSPVNLEVDGERDVRPRSPLIPQQKNKISINLMESIESETSTDSPDKEYANLDLDDLEDSNEIHKSDDKAEEVLDIDKIVKDNGSDSQNGALDSSQISPNSTGRSNDNNINSKHIRIPRLDIPNNHSESEEFIGKTENADKNNKSPHEFKSPQIKSPKFDFNSPSSPLQNFKTPNRAVIAPLKLSGSSNSFGKSLSPRLDGVILSQGKSTDNVVVVYQFESQDENYSKTVKSVLPDSGRDILERNKADERRRLDFALQKELESIRVEFASKERRLKAELQVELRELEDKFLEEKSLRLNEQVEKQKKELEIAISFSEQTYQETIVALTKSMEDRRMKDIEAAERKHVEEMAKLEQEYRVKLAARREQLEIDNERTLLELREQLQAILNRERDKMIEENKATVEALREDHTNKVTELRHDYRAEVERLRTQHACHLEELRSRFANERAARPEDKGLTDKYKCLKEKYARLKHDVKMSIERRNKRREMSMTTGSETEKSNSNKAAQSLDRCKELNETSVSVVIESEPKSRNNNLISGKYHDNETSQSDSNAVKIDNNNDESKGKDNSANPTSSQSQSSGKRPPRRVMVAFKEPPARSRERKRDRDAGTTTDYQDSSDGTADEKPKESLNGPGRRRCFTRLKSASTSRLNYSPKRGEGWSSPLEALRQQLRKLDDLEDQLPDLACQPNYSLRYPFGEIAPVSKAETPELEFVRHRALVEREGMRRARAVLKRRRAALKENRGEVSPHRAPSEERETTELEVALHRARALLGEKEIRLRHIERALRKMADVHDHPAPQTVIQEVTTSEASSASETGDVEATGEVLRSLRALHADVRDIWRVLDVRPRTASPEINSFNQTTSSHNRLTVSAPAPVVRNNSDDGVAERARGLRAWLQTAPQ